MRYLFLLLFLCLPVSAINFSNGGTTYTNSRIVELNGVPMTGNNANGDVSYEFSGYNTSSADVVGPSSSTDNAIVRFNGTTGKIIQNGSVTINDSGKMFITDIQAAGSGGINFTTSGGANNLHLASGGSPNATAYGGWNFDGATANTVASFGASKTLSSLSTATYPSLTEFSYVKGVTSAIQTQINGKQPLSSNLTTLSANDGSNLTSVNAATIDSLDSLQFLRSDTSDFYNGGTLVFQSAGDLKLNGDLTIPTGASNGYVLTSDANGLASWQAATGSGEWTLSTTDLYPSSTTYNVALGHQDPDTILDLNGALTLRKINDSISGASSPSFEAISETPATTYSTATTINATKPTGTALDDLLIAVFIIQDANEVIGAPGGWTEIVTEVLANYYKVTAYYKIADASDVAASTFAFTKNSTSGGKVVLFRYDGADTSNPINTYNADNGSATSPMTSLGVTTTVENTTILKFGVIREDSGDSLGTPTGYTSRLSDEQLLTNSAFWDKSQSAAGASDTNTYTYSAPGEPYVQMTIAIASESGGGLADPDNGSTFFYLSDGSNTNFNTGDLIAKVTESSTTKSIRIVDFNNGTLALGSVDSATFDGLDSTDFLKSNGSDSFTSGTLTMDAGTTVDINSTTLQIADTDITLDGASTTFTQTTGAITMTPAAGSGFNVSLSTTGDFAVNTNGLYLDTSADYVGIGTTAPQAKLQVNGSFMMVDGNEADGYVLTSDANGLASWQASSGAGGNGNAFTTISVPSGTNPVADSATDTLTLAAGSGITITGDSSTDTVTIASTGGSSSGTAWDVSDINEYGSAAIPSFTGGFQLINGGEMVVHVDTSGRNLRTYQFDTAWNPSTIDLNSLVGLSITSEDTAPTGVFMDSNGDNVYMIGRSTDTVYRYPLSTPWDLTTNGTTTSFAINGQELNPFGLSFENNGNEMYVVGISSDAVFQYSLSTPWDITTASYTGNSFSIINQTSNVRSLVFKPDGTKFYVCSASNDEGVVFQYSLSTAWDITTASYDNKAIAPPMHDAVNCSGFNFKSDGTILYYSDTSIFNIVPLKLVR